MDARNIAGSPIPSACSTATILYCVPYGICIRCIIATNAADIKYLAGMHNSVKRLKERSQCDANVKKTCSARGNGTLIDSASDPLTRPTSALDRGTCSTNDKMSNTNLHQNFTLHRRRIIWHSWLYRMPKVALATLERHFNL